MIGIPVGFVTERVYKKAVRRRDYLSFNVYAERLSTVHLLRVQFELCVSLNKRNSHAIMPSDDT